LLAYDLASTVGEEYQYAKHYGKDNLMSDFLEYERVTGKDWTDSYNLFCNGEPQSKPQYSIERFHKDIVIKALTIIA